MANANPTQKGKTKRPPKPGPNYAWNGSRWIWVDPNHGNPTQKGTGRVAPPPSTPARPAQSMADWAQQQAEARIKAEVDAIKAQQAAWEKQQADASAARMAQAQNLAAMINRMGFGQQISGIFNNAGQDIAGMAQGFAGQTRDIASADAAQQLNMLSGTGQEGAVRNEGTGMGDVLYGVGGYIPGKTLAGQGASYGADAALQPAFLLQQRALEEQKRLMEDTTGSEFAKMIAEAQGHKYDYTQEALTDRQSLALKQQAAVLDQLKFEADQHYKMYLIYNQKGDNARANRELELARQKEARYANQARGMAPDGTLLPDYYRDAQGNILKVGTKYNAKGQLVKIKSGSSSSSKNGGLTPNAKNDIMQSTVKQQDDIVKAIPGIAKSTGWNDLLLFKGPLTPAQRKKMQAARNRVAQQLMAHYGTIATTPEAKKALRKMIARLLNEYVKSGNVGGGGSGDSITSGLGD